MTVAFGWELTRANLIGPLNTAAPSIMAEVLFVDLVSDVAVLVEPDGQASEEFAEGSDAFKAFVESITPLMLSVNTPSEPVKGWLLSLDQRWNQCIVTARRRLGGRSVLHIAEATSGIVGGMSGSPILADDGTVLGVVRMSQGDGNQVHTEGFDQPMLAQCLPQWLVEELRQAHKQRYQRRR
jgi:hypothetical protein